MNNKVGIFGYHGIVSDLNLALKTGWYSVGAETGHGYGVLIVQNSSNQDHNNIDNWIWQELRNTAGQYKRRYKVNSAPWTDWVDF